ncbi:MAG: hypothetical protein WBE13_15155 [Candidatus Acidiferrum sp.]
MRRGFIYNLLHRNKRLLLLVWLIGVAGALNPAAQRITILDFSSTVSKPRKHLPKPFPPNKVLGGRCGGMTSGKLIVSLVSLDRIEYCIGDEFRYTLEVRTAGLETVKVPTVFNVADLEPDDPNVSFRYAAMEIWLGMSEESNERYLDVPLLRLYGSDEMPWTEIELKPGMSIEIRGKAKLKPMKPEETFFDAPYMGATEDMPKGEVGINSSCWRGDTFY